MATHSGMTTDEFAKIVRDWMATAKHPKTGRPYTEMIYQPMVELLRYLRANGFKTYIVSGGGIEFMRPWVEQAYGIPPEQVIGSSGKVEVRAARRQAGAREAAGGRLHRRQGRQAGRRSTSSSAGARFSPSATRMATCRCCSGRPPGSGARFMGIVHHTDAEREWAYDRNSHIGRLDKALDEATAKGWTVVSMKTDWKRIFAFEKKSRRGAHSNSCQF